MLAYIWMESQSFILPVRPVCPEAPVWPVEPLAPASSHNSSYCATSLLSSVESTDALLCLQASELKYRL